MSAKPILTHLHSTRYNLNVAHLFPESVAQPVFEDRYEYYPGTKLIKRKKW